MEARKTEERPRPSPRALVVDDQASVRELLAFLFDQEGGVTVTAEAASGRQGLQLFRRYAPDLVIAGLALPEMGGPEMLRAMRAERPAARLLVYTGTRNRALLEAGLAARPHGFVHKTEPLATLRQACAAVAAGNVFFGAFATQLMDEPRLESGLPREPLTPKQRLVLQLIAEGCTTKQLADRLALSPKTVEHYRTELMRRLGLRDVASLTRYAVRCGLVDS